MAAIIPFLLIGAVSFVAVSVHNSPSGRDSGGGGGTTGITVSFPTRTGTSAIVRLSAFPAGDPSITLTYRAGTDGEVINAPNPFSGGALDYQLGELSCGTRYNVSITGVNPTTLTGEFSTNACINLTSEPSQYSIQVNVNALIPEEHTLLYKAADDVDWQTAISPFTSGTAFLIDGLTCNTEYLFELYFGVALVASSSGSTDQCTDEPLTEEPPN
jgi:hypothetical protein